MTSDLYDVEKRLNTVLKKIESLDICKSNKLKLVEFKNHCLANTIGKNKVSRYLYDLIRLAEWLDKPFEKATKKDIEKIMVTLESATRLDVNGNPTKIIYSEWTRRGYRIIVRKFYKWLRGTKHYPDEVEWIKTRGKECNRKLPEEMLSEEEILALINSCKESRDKALIAFLFDSGCRVGELMNIRIRDIEYFDKGMKVYLTGKTGMRRVPVIFSVPYMNNWLNEHPTKKSDSYVWIINNGKRLSYGRVRFILKDSADRVGIIKRVNPHNFRHSRASIYSDKLKDRVMMEYFGWKKPDTIAIYSHLNGKQIENSILEANGIKQEENKEKTILKPKNCTRCKKVHEATALYCNCGMVLDEKLAQDIKVKEMQREKADVIMDKIINDPEVWEVIKKKYS